jgi:hypothetical protein
MGWWGVLSRIHRRSDRAARLMVQVALTSILVCSSAALPQTPILQGGVENTGTPPPSSPPQTPMQSGGAEQNQLAPPPDLPGAHWVARDQDMGPCNRQNYANNALFAKLSQVVPHANVGSQYPSLATAAQTAQPRM